MKKYQRICVYFLIPTLVSIITTIILYSFEVSKGIMFLINIANVTLAILCILLVTRILKEDIPSNVTWAVAITMFIMAIMTFMIWIGTIVSADQYLELAIMLFFSSFLMAVVAQIASIILNIKISKKNRQ